jgi:hypothetical protein
MKRLGLWLALGLVMFVAGAGGFGWWFYDLRWRPHDITRDQAEITRILEGAGWVSPGLTGPKLYMVGFRSCPDCIGFKAEAFPALHAAGIDTRVIEVAQRDVNGLAKSTPAERATVAELWANRSWALMARWDKVPPEAWTAPGIAPADGDAGRTAIVEAGRAMVDQLQPLLAKNGIRFAYPTLIWWTREGKMRGCACEKAQTYRFVLKELGAAEPK